MNPTQILMNEHRIIETVLSCLATMAEAADRDGRIDEQPGRDAVDFFRNYADRCHHAKEEDQLFPMMEERGFSPDQGPTAVMRSEHLQGRELVDRIAESIAGAVAGDADSVREFVDAARSYVPLLRDHITKEDRCLFPMAGRALSDTERATLLQGFEALERSEFRGAQEKYLGIACALADRFNVALPQIAVSDLSTG